MRPAGEVWCTVTVRGVRPPDVGMIDALARLEMAVRRSGGEVSLDEVSPDLAGLLGLCGLSGQVIRQAENREDPRGVQEERGLGHQTP